ncbi:MAG: hypothetical protein Q7K35_03075 [bacterium]|nr:hypothetical protein [bacterium]
MNTNISAENLEILTHREKAVVTAMTNGEKVRAIADRFKVTSSRIRSIRQEAETRIARANKLKKLKGDRVGLYMLRLEEVFPGSVVGPLAKCGFERVGDIRGKSDYQLLHYRGVGKKAVRLISGFFIEHGLEYQTEEIDFQERVAQFIFGKMNGKRRGFGIGAARSAASLAIASGLVTEEGFQKMVSVTETKPSS